MLSHASLCWVLGGKKRTRRAGSDSNRMRSVEGSSERNRARLGLRALLSQERELTFNSMLTIEIPPYTRAEFLSSRTGQCDPARGFLESWCADLSSSWTFNLITCGGKYLCGIIIRHSMMPDAHGFSPPGTRPPSHDRGSD